MHIALITHKVDLNDGQGRVNFEIGQALLKQGHSVTVIAEFCSPQIANHPQGRFVCMRNHPLPTQFLRNWYFAVKSGRWLRRHRDEFDLVQANGFVMWEAADIVAIHFLHRTWLSSSHFPFRWDWKNLYSCYQRLLTIFNAHFEKLAFEQARLLVAVSEQTAADVTSLGIDKTKVRVVRNGINLDEFHPGQPQRDAFSLPLGVPLALFAGDIRTPRKNLETVLHALCRVPELHLVVAGDPEGSPYPRLAVELDLKERTHFIGVTSRMPALLRSVNLFVIPSRYESYGMVALEAMASGLPLILSSKVGAIEFARETSFVLEDPDDVTALTGLFQQVLGNPERARSMAEAARGRALSLDWSDMVKGYFDIYGELLAESGEIKRSRLAEV